MEKFLITLMCTLMLIMQGCASQTQHQGNQAIMEIQARAEHAYKLAMMDQAESLYLEVLRSVPNYAPGWFRLGNIYTRTGRQDAAIAAYQRCIELEPDNQKAWYNMSLVRLKQSAQVLEIAQQHGDTSSVVHRQMKALLQAIYELQREPSPEQAAR
ncbi:tetratricopeptide repeat protein [Shewanella algae]|uniref:tetratricopeptide repeat protein n=1 Tax=Shewanella algae TaxID=38313 RepID=UPI0030045C3E